MPSPPKWPPAGRVWRNAPAAAARPPPTTPRAADRERRRNRTTHHRAAAAVAPGLVRRKAAMTDSPFVVSTRDLGRQPGATHALEMSVTSTHDMGNQVIGVPAGRRIDLDLRLESVMEGVLVTGVARAEASGECVRCLRPVAADVAVDTTELFVYPGQAHPDAEDLGADEALPEVRADSVDLEPTVIDAVVT